MLSDLPSPGCPATLRGPRLGLWPARFLDHLASTDLLRRFHPPRRWSDLASCSQCLGGPLQTSPPSPGAPAPVATILFPQLYPLTEGPLDTKETKPVSPKGSQP